MTTIDELRERGLSVRRDAEHLYLAPPDKVTPELKAEVREAKPMLMMQLGAESFAKMIAEIMLPDAGTLDGRAVRAEITAAEAEAERAYRAGDLAAHDAALAGALTTLSRFRVGVAG